MIIPPTYDTAWEFSEGLAHVELKNRHGFIDVQGKMVIPLQFDAAEDFDRGLAWVNTGGYGSSGWWGYIDKTGHYVWKPSNYKAIDAARLKDENRTPTIKILTDKKSNEKGLLVTCSPKVQSTGPNAGEVQFTIYNLLDEEIFLTVTGFDSLRCELESKDGSSCGMGGQFYLFPDQAYLLKLVHASRYVKGERFTCGCCMTQFTGKIPSETFDMAPARGTIDVMIRGFYRNNGKEFCEFVKLPIELVEKVEPAPTTQPSTRTAPE